MCGPLHVTVHTSIACKIIHIVSLSSVMGKPPDYVCIALSSEAHAILALKDIGRRAERTCGLI